MALYWPLNLFQPIWINLKVWAFAWIHPKIFLERFDVSWFISGPDHFSEKKTFGKQQIKMESKVSSSRRNMEEERKSNCDSEIGKELYSLLYFWLCCLSFNVDFFLIFFCFCWHFPFLFSFFLFFYFILIYIFIQIYILFSFLFLYRFFLFFCCKPSPLPLKA